MFECCLKSLSLGRALGEQDYDLQNSERTSIDGGLRTSSGAGNTEKSLSEEFPVAPNL